VIHENLPHHLGRDTEEVCAIPIFRLVLADQPNVSLVNERGRLQGVIPPLTPQINVRQTPELRVSERHEVIERLFFSGFVSGLDFAEQQRERRRIHVPDSNKTGEIALITLLAPADLPPDNIETVILGAATALFTEAPMEGTRLGSHRIQREIGRGGMGAVYLASRPDDEFRKRARSSW
jgi:hypothetical protein